MTKETSVVSFVPSFRVVVMVMIRVRDRKLSYRRTSFVGLFDGGSNPVVRSRVRVRVRLRFTVFCRNVSVRVRVRH